MQAIVFANRHGNELAPLNSHYCPAAMPIANRAVIEYTLDDLAESGIRQVLLVVSSQAREIEAIVGHGEKWGLQVNYYLSTPQESVTDVLPRLGLEAESSYLLIRGDILRSPVVSRYLAITEHMDAELVTTQQGRCNPGLALLKPDSQRLAELDWPLHCTSEVLSNRVTEVLTGDCFALSDWQEVLEANLAVAGQRMPGLKPRGAAIAAKHPETFFFAGSHCQLPKLSEQSGFGVIGDRCTLNKLCEFKHAICIGRDSVIDRDCLLRDALILPHTYVGPGLSLHGKIVSRDLLLDPATGGWIKINDPALIADARLNSEHMQSTPRWEKWAAATLLGLTLPAWPLVAMRSLLRGTGNPFSSRQLFSNKGAHCTGIYLDVGHRGLQHIPLLWLVLTGKLRLLGACPSRHAEKAGQRGVFGPAQLWLDEQSPAEEIEIVEQHFCSLTAPQQLTLMRQWQQQAQSRNSKAPLKAS